MNKMLTVSLVAILGVVGGGAYVLQDSNKHISEYIPEPVTALIGDYLPDSFKSQQNTAVDSSQFTEVFEDSFVEEVSVDPMNGNEANHQVQQQVTAPQEVAQDTMDADLIAKENIIQANQQNTQQETEQLVVNQSNEAMQPVADQENIMQENDVVGIAMQEIQDSLNDTLPNTAKSSNDPQAKVIENKIVAVGSKIMKIDQENKILEEKFQNIMRKNRELAKKLQMIDRELSNTN